MTTLLRSLPIGALGLVAAFLVACGESNGLLPAGQGAALGSKLDAVSAAVSSGKCPQGRSAAAKLAAEVSSLPPSVDPKLRRVLSDGARTVQRQASKDCRAPTRTTPSTTSTTPSTSTPSTTAPTTSTPPSTPTSTPSTPTRTEPRSTPTAPSTPTSPPKTGTTPSNGGAGTGKGNSNGGGAGGPGK